MGGHDDPEADRSRVRAYTRARTHTHTPVKENGRRGRSSGGALMRMLLIIQFVNSRYILIVLAEPRVTRITLCPAATRFPPSVLADFSRFPRVSRFTFDFFQATRRSKCRSK